MSGFYIRLIFLTIYELATEVSWVLDDVSHARVEDGFHARHALDET